MILDSALAQLFQEQMNRERYNAACYDALAGALENVAWDGFAKWMRKAAAEELEHYKKFNDFLVDCNVEPVVTETPSPGTAGNSDPHAAFGTALQLERENTYFILSLVLACENVGDWQAEHWMTWAVDEQRNAERELTDIMLWFQRAVGNNAALLILDEKLGGD
jgi:ferritin